MKRITLTNVLIVLCLVGLAVAASLLYPLLASAHHTTSTQNASCTGYTVAGYYVGGSSVRRVLTDVDFKLDNVLEEINQDWRGVSNGFTIFTRTGSGNHQVKATGTIKMYECGGNVWDSNQKCDAQTNGSNNHNDDSGWDLLSTETFTLDYTGQCVTPTPIPPTPTASPSATPTMTPYPTPTEVPTPNPTVEVTPTPEITPSPTPEVTPTATPSAIPRPTEKPCGDECKPKEVEKTPITSPICIDGVPGGVANIFVDVGTPNDGKLTVKWLNANPNEGATKAHILYGRYGHPAEHALLNTDNDGVEEIGFLTNGQNYHFKVLLVNGCAVGEPSVEFDPMP